MLQRRGHPQTSAMRGPGMPEYLETTVDKFTFRVATDRLYSPEGVWVLSVQPGPADRVRVGLTDFMQQHSGDVAFVSVKAPGTKVQAGDDLAELETIKVNLSLPSPVGGTVRRGQRGPRADPRGRQPGSVRRWLARRDRGDELGGRPRRGCSTPRVSFSVMQSQVEQELERHDRRQTPGRGRPLQRHRQDVRHRQPRGRLRAVRRAAARRDAARRPVEARPGRRGGARARPRVPGHHHRRLQADVRRQAREAQRRNGRAGRWPCSTSTAATRSSSPRASRS